MRFAVDTVDDSGNDRLYIGTPVEVREEVTRSGLRGRGDQEALVGAPRLDRVDRAWTFGHSAASLKA